MKAALAGIAMAALFLAGCGGDEQDPPPAAATEAVETEPVETSESVEPNTPECATDCVDEYSAAIDALEACDTFSDAQGCDDAIRDLEALHDPILATHGTQAATQVALVESRIAEWDANGCATKNHCTLQWNGAIVEAKQLRLDMKQY